MSTREEREAWARLAAGPWPLDDLARAAVPALLADVERLERERDIALVDAHVIGPANADEVKAILAANAALRRESGVLRAWVARAREAMEAATPNLTHAPDCVRWSPECQGCTTRPLPTCSGEPHCTCHVGAIRAVLADAPKEET